MGKLFRDIRTQQELRMWYRFNELMREHPTLKIRPSRNPANLPTSWEDFIRGDRDARSWKHTRRTQYRPTTTPFPHRRHPSGPRANVNRSDVTPFRVRCKYQKAKTPLPRK